MFDAAAPQLLPLDLPTVAFVAVCIAALLGVLLIVARVRQRNVRAFAWWGLGLFYRSFLDCIVGCAGAALPVTYGTAASHDLPCLCHGLEWRAAVPWTGAVAGRRIGRRHRVAGAVPIANAAARQQCTHCARCRGSRDLHFFIASKLRREQRKSLYSRTAAVVVPLVHAAMFLMPLCMQAFLPGDYTTGWLAVFALETMLCAVGTAFVVLLMVKDSDVNAYRFAALTDPLAGLLNRRAFLDSALNLCARRGERGQPVTMLTLGPDRFKSINDRFGHAIGDDVLRVFANVARSSMCASDIIGRLGGEEFAAILPEPMEISGRIAEQLRAAFEEAGIAIGGHSIGATVSMGATMSYEPVTISAC
jgi:diguanylate cyclase (GGDEF)-like protein